MEQTFNKQTRQQEELQLVFKLRQMMKMAQALKNERLFKKVEDEIEKLLLPPPSINLENNDEDTTTLDSVKINGRNIGEDDDDDDDEI
jgi:predicted GIY-YIG superfamily endonuclease